jgi:hypothetical protein
MSKADISNTPILARRTALADVASAAALIKAQPGKAVADDIALGGLSVKED